MKPHEQRVVDELKELAERRGKLDTFMNSGNNNAFSALPSGEQNRLHRQFNIMREYEVVLKERIEHFPA